VAGATLPFGASELDAHLPGGELRLGHLHEVVEGGVAVNYAGLATLFSAGIAARLRGPVPWCLRGRDPLAPTLARVGLDLARVVYCETWKDLDVIPAVEEGLCCKGLGAVVGEVTRLSLNASCRLQLCAEETSATALVIRRWHNAAATKFAAEPNASDTRWRVSRHPPPETVEDTAWLWQLVINLVKWLRGHVG
jgi:protein ImuA